MRAATVVTSQRCWASGGAEAGCPSLPWGPLPALALREQGPCAWEPPLPTPSLGCSPVSSVCPLGLVERGRCPDSSVWTGRPMLAQHSGTQVNVLFS